MVNNKKSKPLTPMPLVTFKSIYLAPARMIFAVPVSFFKSISIIFGGAGLIFEGLTNPCGCRNGKFCQCLLGVNPQRSNLDELLRYLFGETLSQKEEGSPFTGRCVSTAPER